MDTITKLMQLQIPAIPTFVSFIWLCCMLAVAYKVTIPRIICQYLRINQKFMITFYIYIITGLAIGISMWKRLEYDTLFTKIMAFILIILTSPTIACVYFVRYLLIKIG